MPDGADATTGRRLRSFAWCVRHSCPAYDSLHGVSDALLAQSGTQLSCRRVCAAA